MRNLGTILGDRPAASRKQRYDQRPTFLSALSLRLESQSFSFCGSHPTFGLIVMRLFGRHIFVRKACWTKQS